MDCLSDDDLHPNPPHLIGEDITLLSAGEIRARIAALQTEIERLQSSHQHRNKSREAAEALFRL